MRLLSLDTSFSAINFTLIENGKVVLHRYEDTGKKTLEQLPKLFEKSDIDLHQMDAFAVSLGVGYLTSLRIGITFIKTIAYVSKKPVVGYENLHMMCLFIREPEEKLALLKVSNNVFCRRCKENGVGEVEILQDLPSEVVSVGLSTQGLASKQLEFFPFSLYGGLWAYNKLKEGYQGDDPMLLEPIYLKPPV
ncbi:MAG: tRNA threonylcarbamoyladenosine biosynthesis protein TsaB [Aquificaceae bacterium]|nr:tRNA threonylcarbamoyladenosine biosynthesis protein TsaB [Aquificaceae bacterium]